MSIDKPADTPTVFKIAKRGANEASVTYLEAVEIALCWGLVESQCRQGRGARRCPDGESILLDGQRGQPPCGLVAHSNGRENRDACEANNPTRGDARLKVLHQRGPP